MNFLKNNIAFALITMLVIISSCKNLDDEGLYYSKQNTMVCSFSLQRDTSVLSNLDSIFFTIDLEKSLIYNADSLPKGTDISGIAVKAVFMNPANVYINYEDAEGVVRTFSYLATSHAPVDFRKSEDGKVNMKVIASDGHTSQTYTLKVNVHKVQADSLYWEKIESATISSQLTDIVSSKTVATTQGYQMFAQKSGGEVLVYRTADFSIWESKSIGTMPMMDWRTLTCDGTNLYLLSSHNKLYSCTNLEIPQFTESSLLGTYIPISLIGVYENDKLLSVVEDNGEYKHAIVNIASGAIELRDMPQEFPIKGFSQPITFTSKWTQNQLVVACGEKSNGALTNAVWGFDGANWAILNNAVSGGSLITPRTGAVMFTYYTYDYDSEIDLHTKVLTYFIIGGWDGEKMTNDLFYTTNLGGKWKKAGVTSPMALPSTISPRMGADVFVLEQPLLKKATEGGVQWRDIELVNKKSIKEFISLRAEGQREIPYIYMIGGSSSLQYSFMNEVWKGVIMRLTFPPIP